MKWRRRCAPLGAVTLFILIAANCSGISRGTTDERQTGGNARRGKQAIVEHGCGSCHYIPGVRGAKGQVGPPLTNWNERVYIAGQVPNTADFLVRWIEVPQAIEPKTAMPNLGVTEGEARDIAAYLYSIH